MFIKTTPPTLAGLNVETEIFSGFNDCGQANITAIAKGPATLRKYGSLDRGLTWIAIGDSALTTSPDGVWVVSLVADLVQIMGYTRYTIISNAAGNTVAANVVTGSFYLS